MAIIGVGGTGFDPATKSWAVPGRSDVRFKLSGNRYNNISTQGVNSRATWIGYDGDNEDLSFKAKIYTLNSSLSVPAVTEALGLEVYSVLGGTPSEADINLADAPTIEIRIIQNNDINDIVLKLASIKFSGTLHMTRPSCTTPSPSYLLGAHVSADLNNASKSTPWVDTPLQLTGCHVFHGYNASDEPGSPSYFPAIGVTSSSSSDANTLGTVTPITALTKNGVSLSLHAVTNWVDASQGIIGLASGASTASGINIQLGMKDSSGNKTPVDLNNIPAVHPDIDYSGGTITFPFVARYIADSTSHISGGSANGSIEYTVNYE